MADIDLNCCLDRRKWLPNWINNNQIIVKTNLDVLYLFKKKIKNITDCVNEQQNRCRKSNSESSSSRESKLYPYLKSKPTSLSEINPKRLSEWHHHLKPQSSPSGEPKLRDFKEWHGIKAKRSSSSEPKLKELNGWRHLKSRSSSEEHLAFPDYAKIKPIFSYATVSSHVGTFVRSNSHDLPKTIQKTAV